MKSNNWWKDAEIKNQILICQDPSSPKKAKDLAWVYLTKRFEKLTKQILIATKTPLDPYELSPTWIRIVKDFDTTKNTSSYSFARQYLTWDVSKARMEDAQGQVPSSALPQCKTIEEVPDGAKILRKDSKKIHYATHETFTAMDHAFTSPDLHSQEDPDPDELWDFMESITKKELAKCVAPKDLEPSWHYLHFLCRHRDKIPSRWAKKMRLDWQTEWSRKTGQEMNPMEATRLITITHKAVSDLWRN
jgi:hypothetical protein